MRSMSGASSGPATTIGTKDASRIADTAQPDPLSCSVRSIRVITASSSPSMDSPYPSVRMRTARRGQAGAPPCSVVLAFIIVTSREGVEEHGDVLGGVAVPPLGRLRAVALEQLKELGMETSQLYGGQPELIAADRGALLPGLTPPRTPFCHELHQLSGLHAHQHRF